MLVDEDPVIGRQARRLEELGARGDADPDDNEVALDDGAVAQRDSLDRTVAPESLDDGFGQELDAVVAMELQEDLRDLGAEHVLQRQGAHLEQRHLAPFLARRGGNLGPDPTRADHHQSPALSQPLCRSARNRRRCGDTGSRRDPTRNVKASRGGPGRDQEPVVADALPRHPGRASSTPCRARSHESRSSTHAVVAVERLRVDEGLVLGLLSQVVLGERRPFVGPVRLLPDQDQTAVESFVPQRPPRLGPARPAPTMMKVLSAIA